MFTGKKVLVLTTTDNMIWQFLIPHIKFLQEQGNEVECACDKTGFWYDELKDKFGFTMNQLCFSRFPFTMKNIKARKQLYSLIKEKKYDMIFCHQPVGGVMGRMAGHKFNIPVVYVAHGFHFYKGCPKKNLLYKVIEKYFSKYTDALVTMNEEDYQAALKFKAKKVYKINGIGIDLEKYKHNCDNSSETEELNISSNDFCVISIGELNDNKNHEVVIRAISELKDENIKYFICGQGERREEYESLIKELKLESQVFLLGFRKDIPQLLSLSNVFIMPSKREGLPRSMMEAMSNGLPIIASNIRGCKDLVGDDGGVLVSPTNIKEYAQAIAKIKNDINFANGCKERNLKFIEQYDNKNVLAQIKNVYEGINMYDEK